MHFDFVIRWMKVVFYAEKNILVQFLVCYLKGKSSVSFSIQWMKLADFNIFKIFFYDNELKVTTRYINWAVWRLIELFY